MCYRRFILHKSRLRIMHLLLREAALFYLVLLLCCSLHKSLMINNPKLNVKRSYYIAEDLPRVPFLWSISLCALAEAALEEPQVTTSSSLSSSVAQVAFPTQSSQSEARRRVVFKWEQIYCALLTFKTKYDNLDVDKEFIVPHERSWPDDLHGMRLGLVAKRIRIGRSYTEKRELLQSIGFDFSKHSRRYGWKVIRECLAIYKQLHGNLLVPAKFVIPRADAATAAAAEDNSSSLPSGGWPVDLSGFKLGAAVSQIRWRNDYSKYRAELEAMGFDYAIQCPQEFGFERIKQVLTLYQEQYGDMLVPSSYVVPAAGPYWPEDMWNMKLGAAVSHIRNRNDYAEYRKELIELGFDYRKRRPGRRRLVY